MNGESDSEIRSIRDILSLSAKRYGTRPALRMALVNGDHSHTYHELDEWATRLSSGLIKLGVGKGDRVVILSENRPEWGLAYLAILGVGAVAVPLDVKLTMSEIERLLADCEAKVLCTTSQLLETAVSCVEALTSLETIVLLDQEPADEKLTHRDRVRIVPMAEITTAGVEAPSLPKVGRDDLAVIIYTSGTTGRPKGVILSHGNIVSNVLDAYRIFSVHPEDRLLSILPLNHTFEAVAGLLVPLHCGAAISYIPDLKPQTLTEALQETRPTILIAAPIILRMLHRNIWRAAERYSRYDLFNALVRLSRRLDRWGIHIGKWLFSKVHRGLGGEIRFLAVGGAPIDPTLLETFQALGLTVLQGYGLTEASPMLTANTLRANQIGSVGRPLPSVELRIVPLAGQGEIGEIETRGPNIMCGYFRDDEGTAEVLADGWLKTGDLGQIDRDDYLFIRGRSKNVIVTGGGKNVYPEEVEAALEHSPYIEEVCVIGRSGRGGDEAVCAVIVPDYERIRNDEPRLAQTGARPSITALIETEIERCCAELADYKRVTDCTIWETLPKTSTMKVKRPEVIRILSEAPQEAPVGIAPEEADSESFQMPSEWVDRFREIVAAIADVPKETITPDSNLYRDLGVDSLMKVEIVAEVGETIGVSIPDEAAYELERFQDLFELVERYQGADQPPAERKLSPEDESYLDHLMTWRSLPVRMLRPILYAFARMLFKLYFRLTAHGVEHLPKQGSFIIAPNHSSHLDIPSLILVLPHRLREQMFAAAARDYFFTRPLRRALVEFALNVFPFERMGSFLEGLRLCECIVAKGRSIILFPEGTRSVSGVLQSFKPGLGSLAFELNIPIVPTYIRGSYEAMPKGKRLPRPRRIDITFARPIVMDRYREMKQVEGRSNYEIYRRISEDVRERVGALSERSRTA
ncbi:MAG: AMP-binding protein [Candidatus Bipolaricaulia bacterium]